MKCAKCVSEMYVQKTGLCTPCIQQELKKLVVKHDGLQASYVSGGWGSSISIEGAASPRATMDFPGAMDVTGIIMSEGDRVSALAVGREFARQAIEKGLILDDQ